MTVAEAQGRVDAYIGQFEEGYFPPLAMLARLTEELGELAREVSHEYGLKPKKPDEAEGSVAEELGDLFFVLVCFANAVGVDLDQALSTVLEKYRVRDANRWTRRSAGASDPEDQDGP
ncbi:MAG: nucleotide pyrophosphohydrolase [Clostridia bacterium]